MLKRAVPARPSGAVFTTACGASEQVATPTANARVTNGRSVRRIGWVGWVPRTRERHATSPTACGAVQLLGGAANMCPCAWAVNDVRHRRRIGLPEILLLADMTD